VIKHLIGGIGRLGLWNENMKQELIACQCSCRTIEKYTYRNLKELYKTVWELSMKELIDMSRQRG